MLNIIPNSDHSLPNESEIYNYNNNQNINNPNLKNNDDNSDVNIINKNGVIPLNKYFEKININKYSNENEKNQEIHLKEKSIQDDKSSISAAPILKDNNNSISIEKIEKKNNEPIFDNNKIIDIKSIKSQQSSNTQPITIYVKPKKTSKCVSILYLIIFYLSSITNNVILYFFKSIIERLINL